jgi:23S rRNA-/tRNA-specific pseudouridylate synthase
LPPATWYAFHRSAWPKKRRPGSGAGRRVHIVHEDSHLLVIDKPAGVAVHGGSGVSYGVIEQLRAARPDAKFLELVHRLDRETSGMLLLAKKRSALVNLHEQMREGHRQALPDPGRRRLDQSAPARQAAAA